MVRIGDDIACYRCYKAVRIDTKQRLDTFRRSGRGFCSDDCRDTTVSMESSARMARTNRKHASARMKARNPMRMASARDKMKRALALIDHKPSVRGGNGRPLPLPQAALALALGWPTEVAVPTREPRGGPYPTCYKIDIANEAMKIGVEVDGASHSALSRKAQDAKKDAFLAGLGWSILRFSNREVTADLAGCVQTVLSTISK